MKPTTSRNGLLSLGVAIAIMVAACVPTGGQALGDLRIDEPWARATPPGASVSGGFMTIRNMGNEDDRLVAVTSSAVARVEIHEMRQEGDLMKMRQLRDGLVIPAGAQVSLQPGGYHLMLIEPKQAFAGGDVVLATLHFQRAGDAEVALQVRGAGVSATDAHAGHH